MKSGYVELLYRRTPHELLCHVDGVIVEHRGLLCSTFPVALFDSGTLWLIAFHFSSFRVRKWNTVACCVPLFRLFRVIVEHDGLSCSTFQVIQLDSGTLWLAVFHFSSCSV